MLTFIFPNSNADVERIFSAMNYVKSNITKTDLLNAILVMHHVPSGALFSALAS